MKKKKKRQPKRQPKILDCYGLNPNNVLGKITFSYPIDEKPILKELGDLGKW